MAASPHVYDVIIVGSGVSGLSAAHYLMKARPGLSYLVLEKGVGVGGTWLWNTYPGAACDVPSHWYSFSFALNPGWTRRFSDAAEIRAYLEGVAAREGILPRVRFSATVERTVWEESLGGYALTVRGGDGRVETLRARFVVAGCGALSTPSTPALPGAPSFRGATTHSGAWDPAVSLEGRRVGVIGTGCSAAQIVPAIAGTARSVVVFQRSAHWLTPRMDHGYSPAVRWAFAWLPGVMWLYRVLLALLHDARYFAFVRPASDCLKRVATRLANKHRARAVADPELRAALTPNYPMGCKRVIVSDDFYPALCRPNVGLETRPIARLCAGGVVVGAAPGKRALGGVAVVGAAGAPPPGGAPGEAALHELDVVVYATGFDVVASIDSLNVTGRGGVTMAAAFKGTGGPEAYLGVAAPHFPNMFFMMGPNTGLGHSSMITMIEAQARYAAEAIAGALAEGARAVEVRADVCGAYNKALQGELAKNVWTSCHSWYNLQGVKNVVLWPFTTIRCTCAHPAAATRPPRHFSPPPTHTHARACPARFPPTDHWETRHVDWAAYTVEK